MPTYRYINSLGEVAFQSEFDYASSFDAFGWAGVRLNNKVLYIDERGKTVLESKHANLTSFDTDGLGLLYCPMAGKHTYGILTSRDEWFIPPEYTGLGYRSQGLFCASSRRENLLLDSVGQRFRDIRPYRFADSYEFRSGLVPVTRDDTYFFMNVKGEMVHGPFWSAQMYCDGLAYVQVEEDSAPVFIDAHGEAVLRTELYDHVLEYWSDGLLPVHMNGKCGVINQAGEYQINPDYDSLESLCDGHYLATKQHQRYVLGPTGSVIMQVPREITKLWRAEQGVAVYEKGGKMGYLRLRDGHYITQAIYQEAGWMRHGLAPVTL